jgi:hypothetical protein
VGSKPKVHMLKDTGFRVKGDPVACQYHAICSVYQTAYINPDTTTWRYSDVTCGNCRKKLVGKARVNEPAWKAWLERKAGECAADCSARTVRGPICETCLCCQGCAGAYDYKPVTPGAPPPTKGGKCPGCKL